MLYSLQLPFSARKPWQSVTTLDAELGSRSERQGLGLTSIVLGPLNACLRGACLPGILSMSGESDLLLIVMKIIQVSGYWNRVIFGRPTNHKKIDTKKCCIFPCYAWHPTHITSPLPLPLPHSYPSTQSCSLNWLSELLNQLGPAGWLRFHWSPSTGWTKPTVEVYHSQIVQDWVTSPHLIISSLTIHLRMQAYISSVSPVSRKAAWSENAKFCKIHSKLLPSILPSSSFQSISQRH